MKTRSISSLSTATLALCGMAMLASQGLAADKDTLVAADVKFIKHEAAAGMGLVKIAGFGVKKTGRADIKAFAEMLVTEHTKSNEELAKLAASKGAELSTVIDPDQAKTYQKLEKESGTDFDKEFLATIVSGHKKCVSNFEEASEEAKDNDLKTWAGKMLPALKTHLAQAKGLSSNSAVSAANQPDNTKRNMSDRDAAALTPIDKGNN
jgi:putative membrane protein